MGRQVDIKALVSHIVRGDGADKCRICLGDTTEGQVYLGDTVMLDGERPVTLAELLEVITGVEVLMEDEMPDGLCSTCAVSALDAADFRTLCRQAANQWDSTLQLLKNLPPTEEVPKYSRALFAIVDKDQMTLVNDFTGGPETAKSAVQRLTARLNKTKEISEDVTDNNYQCPNCGKKFLYPQHLYQHLKESSDYQRACHICAKIMSRDELVIHLSEVHDREPYACKKCPALMRSFKQYMRHLAKAHAPGACTCGDCGRNFKSSHAFYAHLSIHALKTCPGCDKLFRNQTCYLYHVKRCCDLDSNREDTYRTKNKVTVEVKNVKSEKKIKVGMRGSADKECICDYCNKKFAGKKFVAAHIQIVHMKNTHRPCIYCGKFLAAAHMTEHVKRHELVRTYTCEHCGIALKTKLGYIQHIRLHTGEKPYACQHCGETFSASSRRSEHIRKTHKSSSEIILKHSCEFCPARFRLPYRLKKHLATVHNSEAEESQPQFECTVCHEKFSSCRGLLHHSRKHQQPVYPVKKSPKKEMQFKVYSEPMKTLAEEVQ